MLTGKQKRYLRAMGTELTPIIQVGKAGVIEPLAKQLEEALEARELVKVRVITNAPVEPEEFAQALADSAGAELVQIIGRNILFYRPSLKNPTIELPK